MALGGSVFLFGTLGDDGLPDGTLTSLWSQVAGPGTVAFAEPDQLATLATPSAQGTYTLRLTGDDGALQAHDELQLTVTAARAITLLSPNGGVAWSVGATELIRWDTVAVNDVALHYSIDDGATWFPIAYTVDTVSTPEWWGSYPWEVPDTPSSSCRVRVVEYNATAPEDQSDAPFAIVRWWWLSLCRVDRGRPRLAAARGRAGTARVAGAAAQAPDRAELEQLGDRATERAVRGSLGH